MFKIHKRQIIKTVLITNSNVLTGDSLMVASAWQQRHVPQNLPFVLNRAVLSSSNDSLDKSLTQYLQSQAANLANAQPLHSFSFDHRSGVSGNIRHKGADYQIDIKGLPERVLDLCDISDNERESIMLQIHKMSVKRLHVIALASGSNQRSIKQISELGAKEKLTFTGLIGLRLEVSAAARQCMQIALTKNITVYFATGLHPTVAYYIGREVRIVQRPGDVYDMRRSDITHPEQTHTILNNYAVFARTSSEQKTLLHAELKNIESAVKSVDSITTFQKLLAAIP